jgi:hypothetical protein
VVTQLKPLFIKNYENTTAVNLSKYNNIFGCPIWARSEFNLEPNLSIIGAVSKSTGILILNREKRFSDSSSTGISLATKTD